MKNEHKLNEAFSNVDDSLIEKTAQPTRRKRAKLLYISLVAAALAVAVAASVILPAMLRSDPQGDLPSTHQAIPAPGGSTEELSPEAPDQTVNKEPTGGQTPAESPLPTPTPAQSTPTPQEDNDPVPAWYLPGELSVRSLTLNSALSARARKKAPAGRLSASNVTLDAAGNPKAVIGSRYVNVTGLYASSEHNTHGCLLYDVEKNGLICFGCFVRELLVQYGLEPTEDQQIVIDAMTSARLVSFAIYDLEQEKIAARYIYEPEKALLRALPLLSDNDFDLFRISSDGRYMLTGSVRPDTFVDFYLIDTATLAYRRIGEGYRTHHEEANFSPDGRSVLLVLADENGATHLGSEKVRRLLINVETGNSAVIEGKILSYADGALITRAGGEYFAFDRASCQKIAVPENTFFFETRGGNVLRINACTGREETLCGAPDAWQLSDDGLFAYAYRTGESYLSVYSLENGSSFNVELSKEFVDTVKRQSIDHDVRYLLDLNEKGNELLICYTLNEKTQTPAVSALECIKAAFAGSDSIIGLVQSFEEAYEGTVSYDVYRGEGFIQVYFENFVAVEDYRNGTFTLYYDPAYSHSPIGNIVLDTGEERMVTCSSGAEQTNDFIARRGWRVAQADVDYARFYDNGRFSRFLANDYITTPEYLEKVKSFTPSFDYAVGVSTGEVDAVRAFIAELHDCEKSFDASAPYSDAYKAEICLYYGSVGEILRASILEGGAYAFQAHNNDYLVPEYVFADYVTLIAGLTLRGGGSASVGAGAFERFIPYTLGQGEIMSVAALTAMLEGGVNSDELLSYACRALSCTAGRLRLIYPVQEGGEIVGYLYLKVMSDGEVRNLFLFDENYRYICFPQIDGMPEGEWTYMGRLDYGFTTPAEPVQKTATAFIVDLQKTVVLSAEEQEHLRMALADAEQTDAESERFDAVFTLDGVSRYFNSYKKLICDAEGHVYKLSDAGSALLDEMIGEFVKRFAEPEERMIVYGSVASQVLSATKRLEVLALLGGERTPEPLDLALDFDYIIADEGQGVKYLYNSVTGQVGYAGYGQDAQYRLPEEARLALNEILAECAGSDEFDPSTDPEHSLLPTEEESGTLTVASTGRHCQLSSDDLASLHDLIDGLPILSDYKEFGYDYVIRTGGWEIGVNLQQKIVQKRNTLSSAWPSQYPLDDGTAAELMKLISSIVG